jgi:hypothetical protein
VGNSSGDETGHSVTDAVMETRTMRFEDLLQFIERDMRMSHVYQPVMLRELFLAASCV